MQKNVQLFKRIEAIQSNKEPKIKPIMRAGMIGQKKITPRPGRR
jgi:hypothetical protein